VGVLKKHKYSDGWGFFRREEKKEAPPSNPQKT
jgi:hypothetical protein